LIAWWDLEEAGASVKEDAHTNGIDLTPFNTVTQVSGVGGVGFGQGLPGAGNSFYSAGGDVPAMDMSGGFSMVFWAKFPSAIPTINHASIGKTSAGFEFRIQFLGAAADTWAFEVYDSGATPYGVELTGYTPAADVWHMVACTNDNSLVKISVNAGAQQQNTGAVINPSGTGYLNFGDQDFAAAQHYDKVGWWGRALTTDEITFLYGGGAGRVYVDLP
jgi:hypothetical protein